MTNSAKAPLYILGARRRLRSQQRAWGRLPHAWVRNTSVAAETLVLMAYRVTFAGEWVSHAADLKTIVSAGLGRDVVERARANARSAGYLKRWQPLPDRSGRYQLACEQLLLPHCTRRNSQIIQRTWFEGILTLKEMAILLMVRAGADAGEGKSGYIQADQIAKRFGWHDTGAHAGLQVLQDLHLVQCQQERDARGHYAARTYAPLRMPFDALRADASSKPGRGNPGRGSSGYLRTRGYLESLGQQHETEIERREQIAVLDAHAIAQAISQLRSKDFARTLSPTLLEDVDGLRRFLRSECAKDRSRGAKLTVPEIAEVIGRVLIGHAIDGRPIASIFSWRFFAGAIGDEFPEAEQCTGR